jgi:hypothetical protein
MFYAEVFGWTNEGRPTGVYHRLVPGDQFKTKDGSPSEIGNLHIGIFNSNNPRPFPTPEGPGVAPLSAFSRRPRHAARGSCGRIITGASSTAIITPSKILGATRSSCGARPARTPLFRLATRANDGVAGCRAACASPSPFATSLQPRNSRESPQPASPRPASRSRAICCLSRGRRADAAPARRRSGRIPGRRPAAPRAACREPAPRRSCRNRRSPAGCLFG